MPKSPDAFRTISEVADWLGIQAHVLRFWESKFSQVKPIKRAGGRRYYRPNDMLLLGGIRQLLHEDGLTIKGVQKILREEGMSHVASLSQPLDELTQSQVDDGTAVPQAPMQTVEPAQESAVVLNFDVASAPETELTQSEEVDTPEPVIQNQTPEPVEAERPAAPEQQDAAQEAAPTETPPTADAETLSSPEPEAASPEPDAETPTPEPEMDTASPASETETSPSEPEAAAEDPPTLAEPETEEAPVAAALPAFLRRPMADETPKAPTDNTPAEANDPEPASPKPRIIDMPTITPIDQIKATPALLTKSLTVRSLTKAQAKEIAPLLDRLKVMRDSMAAHRRNTPGPDA